MILSAVKALGVAGGPRRGYGSAPSKALRSFFEFTESCNGNGEYKSRIRQWKWKIQQNVNSFQNKDYFLKLDNIRFLLPAFIRYCAIKH